MNQMPSCSFYLVICEQNDYAHHGHLHAHLVLPLNASGEPL